MKDFLFANKINPLHTNDPSEALGFAETLKVEPYTVRVKDLKVNEDGTVQYNGEPQKITKYGFLKFCKVLGIPASFARDIPPDLLLENIQRLSSLMEEDEIVLLRRSNLDIAGISKGDYKEPSYIDVLSSFSENPNLKYINVSEELLTICLEEGKLVHKTDEDTLNVSTYIYSSILQECKIHGYSGLYRSSCENSFVMPYFGSIRANYKHEDTMLSKFADLIHCYDEQIYKRINTNFDAFNTRKLFDTEIAAIWKGIHKVVNSSEADSLLLFDEESRKALLSTVFVRGMENRRARLEGRPIDEKVLTEVPAYDILNNITSYSRKNLFGADKLKIEKLAGSWIEKIILN